MLDRLLASIKDPDLARKIKAVLGGQRSAAAGSHPCDHVNLKASGRIKVEKYDRNGEILDVIEQRNMLTDKAFEILTQILAVEEGSGLEPRMPLGSKTLTDLSFVESIDPRDLYAHELYPAGQAHRPRNLQNIVFNNSPTYPYGSNGESKLAVSRIRPTGYRIRFMGIGDGTSYNVPVTDGMFEYGGDWTLEGVSGTFLGKRMVAKASGATITIKFRGTMLEGYFTIQPDGADVNIEVDGSAVQGISLYSGSVAYNTKRVIVQGLENTEHTVVLSHAGTGFDGDLEEWTLAFEGAVTDGLVPKLNALFHEIPTHTNVISEPETYNTTNTPPYKIVLSRGSLGVVPQSEVVKYGSETLVRVDVAPTQDNEYQIDYTTGEIRFNRPLTGVLVKYSTQEEFYTGYWRSEIIRPQPGDPNYPYFNLADKTIFLTADFPPGVPDYPITVREVALFDYSLYVPQAKMFAIVRPGEIFKEPDVGLRITWEIKLQGQE